MLHYKTVDEFTLELLKKLQSLRIFSQMRLVGGTSLALQIGHRKSVDIDLFGLLNVDFDALTDELKSIGDVVVLGNSKNIHTYLIDEIKVDIVHYEYPWLKNKIVSDKIHLAAIEDIAAMKLSAIIGRAERVNGILKNEFNLDSTFKDLKTAQKAVLQAIKTYNELRPHLALKMKKPIELYAA